MATINQFEDFEVWQLARQLCLEVIKLSINSDLNHDFSLKDQIKRSSGSIMDNIAEGYGRDGNKEFVQFLSYAKGSASEVQSQLYRVLDSKYIEEIEFKFLYDLANNIKGKITNLIKHLSNSSYKGSKYR